MTRDPSIMLTIDYEHGESVELSAAEIWKLIFCGNKKWMLSANGTIFSYEKEGIIPGLLTKWFAERKAIRSKIPELNALADGIEIDNALAAEVHRILNELDK